MPLDVRASFLRAIAAEPYDDLPRLVFADWLQEHREYHRAVFIRAQCELARAGADDPRRAGLERTAAELSARHERRWRRELPPVGPLDAWGPFRRGFADTLRAPGCSGRLAELATNYPVTRLQLGGMSATAAEDVVRCDAVSGVRELSVGGTCWPALLREPSWPELGRLEIVSNAASWAVRLWEMRAFPKLEALSFAGRGIPSELAGRIISAEHWPRLKELDLGGNELWPEGAFDRPLPRRITSLSLAGKASSGRFLVRPLRAGWFRHVRSLDLSRNMLGDADAARLAGSPLDHIEELNLSHGWMTRAGVAELTRAPWWPRLRSLDLRHNPIDDAGRLLLLEAVAGRAVRVRT